MLHSDADCRKPALLTVHSGYAVTLYRQPLQKKACMQVSMCKIVISVKRQAEEDGNGVSAEGD